MEIGVESSKPNVWIQATRFEADGSWHCGFVFLAFFAGGTIFNVCAVEKHEAADECIVCLGSSEVVRVCVG